MSQYKTTIFLAPIIVILVFAICSIDKTRPIDDSQDIDAINALLSEHVEAVNTSNTTLNLSGFTDDVVYMPPQGPALVGKDKLTNLVESAYTVIDAEIQMIPEETVVSGDWAFQWGNFDGVIVSLESGDSTVLDSKFIYIYQRQEDGTWKIARDMYNSNLAAQ